MKFRDEFKNEIDKISPNEEQISRIAENVHGKLYSTKKKRKPLYMRIALGAGGVCAAAIIVVVGSNIIKGRGVNSIEQNFTGNTAGGNAENDLYNEEGYNGNATPEGTATSLNNCSYTLTMDSTDQKDIYIPDTVIEFDGDICILKLDGKELVYRMTNEILFPDGDEINVKIEGGGDCVVQFDEKYLTVLPNDTKERSYYIRVD